jgi:pyruvate dehydrogenase E2 component (dihydrolipoamide acetyltransferase)
MRIEMTESPRGLPVKQTIRLKSIRKVMAQTMKRSVDNAALSQVSREIDLTALQMLRREKLVDVQLRVSLNTLIMAAVARTLPLHPLLNAELVERDILVYDTVNLGMAVATPSGLVVVVLRMVHTLTLFELAAAIEALVDRARRGAITMEDVEGGTFTVSNLGMYGVDGGFPLPRPPEGAILMVGQARAKPAVVEEKIVIRDIAWFNLTFDHRFIDGVAAASFLQDLNNLIVAPEGLLDGD